MKRAVFGLVPLMILAAVGCSSPTDRSGHSQANANGNGNGNGDPGNPADPNGTGDPTGDPSDDNPEGPGDQDGGTPNGDCTFNASSGAMTLQSGWHDVPSLTTVGLKDRGGVEAVWTGHEALAVSGFDDATAGATIIAGVSYDPVGNTWKRLPDPPILARSTAYVTMAGPNRLVVWGGGGGISAYDFDGAIFDLCTKTWTGMPDAPIVGRNVAAYGWIAATNEFVVYGGNRSSVSSSDPHKGPIGEIDDGAAFSLTTGTWRMISSPTKTLGPMFTAFYDSTTTSSQLVLYGGGPNHGGGPSAGIALAWDATTDTWTKLDSPSIQGRQFNFEQRPVKLGDTAYFMGGSAVRLPLDVPGDGAYLDTKTMTWTTIAAPTADVLPSPLRDGQGYFVLGGKLYQWGGWSPGGTAPAAGAVYDLSAKTWSSMADGGPGNLTFVYATTMNGAALVWGDKPMVFVP